MVCAHTEISGIRQDYFDAEFTEFEAPKGLTIDVPLNMEELHFLFKLVEDFELNDKLFNHYQILHKRIKNDE